MLAEPGGLRHLVAVMVVESVGGNWGPLSDRRLGRGTGGSQQGDLYTWPKKAGGAGCGLERDGFSGRRE